MNVHDMIQTCPVTPGEAGISINRLLDICTALHRRIGELEASLNQAAKPDTERLTPCPNCKETAVECACQRNRCLGCGGPVGNVTFTYCDECWNRPVPIIPPETLKSMDALVCRLAERFLLWELPESVCSDSCVCMKGLPRRFGTNLLTAMEAEQMIRYLLSTVELHQFVSETAVKR